VTVEGCALFDTAIGRCGIAWDGDGRIVGVQLPERDDSRTLARLLRRTAAAEGTEGTPPAAIHDVIVRVVALLEGETVDLSGVELADDGLPDYERRVYAVARTIPPGETLTYGEVAVRVGTAGDARAVGQAMGRNPFPIIVPCHRVVAADGALGGFSANGGAETKRRMLVIEGAAVAPPTLFDPH
jgi:methylated-DNA-[protein]-cysteine S-methyltransferase